MPKFRKLKRDLAGWLASPHWRDRLAELDGFSPLELSGPLFALLLNPEEIVRWRAVTAFGMNHARLAEARMEDARVLMRNCMWHLNEESGNLGWGIPECMGESMARNERLAKEYHKLLGTYANADPEMDGNFLDHVQLRRGVYWGLARLGQERPGLLSPSESVLLGGLKEPDSTCRGFAAWGLGLAGSADGKDALAPLLDDHEPVTLYRDEELGEATVSALAREALDRLGTGG